MLSLALLFVLMFFSPVSMAVKSYGEERELVYVLLVICLFILHALMFVIFLFLLVSGVGCGLGF